MTGATLRCATCGQISDHLVMDGLCDACFDKRFDNTQDSTRHPERLRSHSASGRDRTPSIIDRLGTWGRNNYEQSSPASKMWRNVFAWSLVAGTLFWGYESVFNTAIESEKEARQRAPDTYVSAEAGKYWSRIVVRSDATYDEFGGLPSSSSWGEPTARGTWSITSDKYVNTGERFYAIHTSGGLPDLIFVDANHLRLDGPEGTIRYTRGDKFPFSK
jgi:hypothetical protein